MEIRESQVKGVTCVALFGRLDELVSAEVESAFTALVGRGVDRLVLDLTGVEYISSSGLRVLLMLVKAMNNNRGRLKICGLSPFVAEVFEVSNFMRLFAVYSTAEIALEAFAAECGEC